MTFYSIVFYSIQCNSIVLYCIVMYSIKQVHTSWECWWKRAQNNQNFGHFLCLRDKSFLVFFSGVAIHNIMFMWLCNIQLASKLFCHRWMGMNGHRYHPEPGVCSTCATMGPKPPWAPDSQQNWTFQQNKWFQMSVTHWAERNYTML